MTKQETIDRVLKHFDERYACSQSILLTFCGRFGLEEETAKRLSSTFGGGMGRLREKCGALTGAFMVLGLAYGNTNPKDLQTKLAAYSKVRELNEAFEKIYGASQCRELLKKHATEADIAQRKHHDLICRKVVGEAAGLLYDMLK